MSVVIDANCLVSAALPQHEHHATTVAELQRRRAAGHTFVMASHAVLEAYAVLTRLPPPHRLSAADAADVLDRNWGGSECTALTGSETWKLVRHEAAAGVSGARIYDAVIAATARKAKADEILSWNVRHFAGAQPAAVSPGK